MPATRQPDLGPRGSTPMDPLPDDRMLMQRKLSQFLASAAPLALAAAAGLFAAAPAHADTTVSTGTTTTLNTSTAGNVTVASTGTLTAPAGTTTGVPAITVDSSNTVTINGGGIVYAGTALAPQNNAIGIKVNPGVTTTISNDGTIYALENYTPTINGTYLTGNISGVSGRYGIYIGPGGTVTGSITNSGATTVGSNTYTGSIIINGENSAGIQIDSALVGSVSNEGTITVLGDNSYGIKLAGVTGNVTVGGNVTVTGAAAQGYVQSGAVSGVVLIDGTISNSYSYVDSSGTSLTLSKSLLNTGNATGIGTAPIVEIDGNVAGGILINAPTSSTSSDTNRGGITAFGNNAALQIGGATDITIGANAATDNGTLNPNTNSGSFALGIDGAVSATAYTSGTAAYGVVIGGRGGNVTLTGGMEIYGSVSATTSDTAATAILINAGSTVGTILNTGTVKAVGSGQSSGSIYAIQDLSGSVTTLTNQGYISATGSATGPGAAVVAIDLSQSVGTTANPVTLTQSYTAANLANQTTDEAASTYNPLTATLYAGITGDIHFGTGTNVMAINSGSVTGNTFFGNGSTNTITAGDVTRWNGNINLGDGGGAIPTLTMTMSKYAQFNGTLNMFNGTGSLTLNDNASFLGTVTGTSAFGGITNGANLNVAVNGGTFGAGVGVVTTSTINSLHVFAGGSLAVYIDGSTGGASKLIANSATFDTGAKIKVTVGSLANIGSTMTYDVLTATTLTGASGLTSSSLNLPVLFNAAVSTDANNVYVTLSKASAAQLGLTTAQTAAYSAILNVASANTLIQGTLLNVYDTPTLRGRFNEMLPDYAGGTFDVVTRATRIADKHFDDDTTIFSISDAAAWMEPIVFEGTRTFGDTPGFKSTGGGLSMGVEKVTPIGNIGFQLAWLSGDAKAATYQSVKSSEFELGLFWRKSSGPFYIWAGGNLGRESFKSSRTFFGQYVNPTPTAVTTTNFTYAAAGHWAGWSGSVNTGLSYTLPVGEHFSLRPRGVFEYDHLEENHYIESGDTALILSVAGRESSQAVATTTLAAKWSAGPGSHEGRPFAIEVEGGRRTWLAGTLGTTTATVQTGDMFSINGGHLPSAWVSQFSIMQGGLDYTWKIGADAERGTDKGVAYGVRASISIAL